MKNSVYNIRMDINKIKPQIIALGGFPGTGKSTIVRALRDEFGFPADQIVSSDRIFKEIYAERHPGFDMKQEVPDEFYEDLSGKIALARRFFGQAREIVASGKPALIHSAFTSKGGRLTLGLGTLGKPVTGFWLQADRDELQHRLVDRQRENLSHSTSSPERLKLVFERHAPAPKNWHEISTQDVTPSQVAAQILQRLEI